jgi:cation diffusion facilitator family transporter
LSALIETFLLLITCVWIIYEAVDRIMNKNTHIEVTIWSYIVVVSSIIIDINRSRMLSKAAKKHNSQALEADALHFSTDIWSSVVVLFGLIGAQLGLHLADSVAAIAVAFIVLFVSYRLGKRAIDVLLDSAPKGSKSIIDEVIQQYPEVKKFHQLKIRTSGADTFIKFNIHVDPMISLKETHELCDKIEMDIKIKIPRSEVFIHAEPEDETHNLQEIE